MPPSRAERLGVACTDFVAVVHVDDFGMCHTANVGRSARGVRGGPAVRRA